MARPTQSDLFDTPAPAEPNPVSVGLYGPPEPVWLMPYPWGAMTFRINRGAITEARDAGSDRTWLKLTGATENLLVAVPVEWLRADMPTLPIDGKRGIDHANR